MRIPFARFVARSLLCGTLVVTLGTATPVDPDGATAPALAAPDRSGAVGDDLTLDLLTYNVKLLPFLPEGKRWRTPRIAERLRGHDVVLLQEAFSDAHRKLLVHQLSREYPYRTRVLGRDGWFSEDGGVVILSRWPIAAERELVFGPPCQGSDCLADKGALYARIDKNGRRFHVIGTHLQSGPNRAIREHQMTRIRDWIDELRLPAEEPVLIGGDLNTDRFSDGTTGAFTRMLGILRAAHPAAPDGVHQPTYDPQRNPLSRGSTGRYVDYVLYATDHLPPDRAFNDVQRFLAEGRGLSDHFAVHGHFVFGTPLAEHSAGPVAGVLSND